MLAVGKPAETFFGGYPVSRLVVKAGAEVPWHGAEYDGVATVAQADAVVVHPAFAAGDVAAFAITEVWENHPDPWVEPVYQFVEEFDADNPFGRRKTSGGKPVPGLFGVGTDSTFYSPFWRLQFAVAGSDPGPFTNVHDITQYAMHRGPVVICPIVPDGVRLSAARRPLSGDVFPDVAVGPAYVNGALVSYLDFGPNRQVANAYEDGADGTVTAADLYVWVSLAADGTRTLLELPPVLPAEAHEHAYVRRVDVVLGDRPVFVPAALTALRAKLVAAGVTVPPADPAISAAVAARYALRVAAEDTCFSAAANFPQGCEWLDDEARVVKLTPANRIIETLVTYTATPVLLGAP